VTTAPNTAKAQTKNQSPLVSVLINVIAPVAVLNRLPKWAPDLNPWIVLSIALAFPIFGAIENVWRTKRVGGLPLLGAVNVLVSGGLTASGVGGIWFQIKEAFFPLLIGIFVWRSAYTDKPFVESLLLNDALVHIDKVRESLKARGNEAAFHVHLKRATIWMATSFFLSAVLNFILASIVFKPLAEGLTDHQRTALLSEQLAKMTGLGFVVIALPSALCMGLIFWILIKDLKKLTDLKDEDLFRQ
jgi:hypothetical protein